MSIPNYSIAMDFDDVAYDFCGGVTAVLADEGITGEISQWEMEHDFGLSKADFWELVYQPKHHETLFLQPVAYTVLAQIRRLVYAGHALHIVTARDGEHPERFCREVLAREKIPASTLTFTSDKAAAVRELEADFALDDRPKNVIAMGQAGAAAFLMTAPHNTNVTGLPRVHNMTEFTNTVIGFQDAGVQLRGIA